MALDVDETFGPTRLKDGIEPVACGTKGIRVRPVANTPAMPLASSSAPGAGSWAGL